MYNNPYSNYPYGGYSYPNYGQRQFIQPQPQMQPQPQLQNVPQQPILPTICYAKMEEAKPFIITSPNTSMLFIDRENNKALLKATDNACSSFSRYFNIEETDENGNALKTEMQNTNSQPQVDMGLFAKKTDLEGFVTVEQYNSLAQELKGLQKQIMGVKPNVPRQPERNQV